MRVELLPRKEFEIHTESQVIKGKFSNWATKRFCDKKKITLSQLDQRLSADSMTIDDVVEIILCAIEHKCREEKKPMTMNDFELMNLFEDHGGFMGEKFLSIVNHASAEEKKKSGVIEWEELQRLCYASGMSADEFWDSTTEEVILRYKGKVDEWRFIRSNTALLHASFVEKPVNVKEYLPLPFDDELEDEVVDPSELYKDAIDTGYFEKPI